MTWHRCCHRVVDTAHQQFLPDSGARASCLICSCTCNILLIIAISCVSSVWYLSILPFDKLVDKVGTVDRAREKSAEQAGDDSGPRVAARISRLGSLTIDVAETMDIKRRSWAAQLINLDIYNLWKYYQEYAENLRRREAFLKGEVAKSVIGKKAGSLAELEFDNAVANKTNSSPVFYVPSPLLNPFNRTDQFDYFQYFFMNHTGYEAELETISTWVNPRPTLEKIRDPWATMQSDIEWHVYSAVPVASHSGNQGPALALIGADTHQSYDLGDERDVPYQAVVNSKHFAIFPSGEVKAFKKYRRQFGKAGNTMTWFADLPAADAAAWMYPPGRTQEACLTFGILNESHFLKNFTSCHNPSTLPPAGSQYDFTICYPIPPMNDLDKPEYSGYLHLPQSIMYHLRHGVDQVVVYLGVEHREHALALLSPFTARRKCTIVLLDSEGSPHEAITNESSASDYRVYNLSGISTLVENYLHNDCLNRFRGRTRFMATLGFDEFVYARDWRVMRDWAVLPRSLYDTARPMLSNGCVKDFTVMGSFSWFKPVHPLEELLLNTTEMYADKRRGFTMKPLLIADCVSLTWTHGPSDCFGRRCNEFHEPLLQYAHVRLLQGEDVAYIGLEDEAPDNKTVVSDNFFEDELALLKPELCRWMKEAGFGCRPGQWLP